MRRRFVGLFALGLACIVAPRPGLAAEAVASKGWTIQPSGVRTGRMCEAFLNVEGNKNGEAGKNASFGVLEFASANMPAGSKLHLTLTQSVARFSVDDPVQIFLVTGPIEPEKLKFDRKSPGGLRDQIPSKAAIGSGQFRKSETGKFHTSELTLGEAAVAYLKACAEKKVVVRLLIIPGDETVAATYFGPGAEESSQRPKLSAGPNQ